jgi:hypothetical protein
VLARCTISPAVIVATNRLDLGWHLEKDRQYINNNIFHYEERFVIKTNNSLVPFERELDHNLFIGEIFL